MYLTGVSDSLESSLEAGPVLEAVGLQGILRRKATPAHLELSTHSGDLASLPDLPLVLASVRATGKARRSENPRCQPSQAQPPVGRPGKHLLCEGAYLVFLLNRAPHHLGEATSAGLLLLWN